MEIDIVIPWVDGKDPALKEKRRMYGDTSTLSRSDVGGDTRYADLGEIHWCIGSINRFAPFIRKIFIITDGQDPKATSRIPVEIVDHKDIFKGREHFLPVFNSNSIETLIWNIPDLSEHFLLLNDDFVIIKPVEPEDFFTQDGKAVCYADKRSTPWAEILYRLSIIKYGYARATYKKSLMKGCRMGGMEREFLHLAHTPRAQFKSVYKAYCDSHPEAIEENLATRFRDISQFEAQALHYALLFQQDRATLAKPSRSLMFIQHWKGTDYLKAKFRKAENTPTVKFACFNSLDQASSEQRELVTNWMKSIIEA